MRRFAIALPDARAWLFSLRCFTAAMIALYIAFAADLPRPYWAMTSVYIASQPLSGATRSKAMFRLLGTLLGAAATVALVPNLVDAPVLLSLALACWVGICLFMSLLDRTPRSYVFLLAGYSAAIIGFPSVDAPGAIFDTAVARVEEISLGIVCASVMHSLVFPSPVGPAVAARIASALRAVERWAAGALAGDADAVHVGELRRGIATAANELDTLGTYLAFDPTQRGGAPGTARQFRWRLLLMMPVVASIRDRTAALLRLGPLSPEIDALLHDTRAWLRADQADLAAQGERLRDRIGVAEVRIGARAGWTEILTAGLLLRLRDLTQLWEDGLAIERQVRAPERFQAVMRYPADAAGGEVRQVDYGMAVWSAVSTAAAIGLCCVLWILGAWDDGSVAAEMAAVTCCFFATRDDPAPLIVGFLQWTVVALMIDLVLLFGVLPGVSDFPVLILALAPPFLLCGALMAMPATAFAGMAIATPAATLLSLQSAYAADLPSFVNIGVASVLGMAIAAVVTTIIRSVGAEWSTQRLLRQARSALAAAALRRGTHDRSVFAGRMLDRTAQLVPRLALIDTEGDTAASHLLAELRVGLNIVDLRRARHALPDEARAAVDTMLDGLAAYFSRGVPDAKIDRAPLLAQIDRALAAVIALPDDEGRRDALLGLVGVRCSLLPDAPPYVPAPLPPAAFMARRAA